MNPKLDSIGIDEVCELIRKGFSSKFIDSHLGVTDAEMRAWIIGDKDRLIKVVAAAYETEHQ